MRVDTGKEWNGKEKEVWSQTYLLEDCGNKVWPKQGGLLNKWYFDNN